MKLLAILLITLFLGMPFSSHAEGLPLVEKKVFTTENFETWSGEIIPEVNIGWEAYGELNETQDNVILITHFFSGNSHAAGKYSEDDPAPGYWDAIIGPGKAIDTNKYYVISADTLVNQEPYNPMVTTTGPATINPATGEPWGLDFPVVTIRDFVNTQKALLDSLGIDNLHAVVGASMGSLQALDWAAAYPEMVERVVHVIGMAEADPWTIAVLQQWADPISNDPNWNGGDYYQGASPTQGVQTALGMITLGAMHPQIVNQLYAASSATEEAPKYDIQSNFMVVEQIKAAAAQRAAYADANHILYLVRANQLFMAGYEETLAKGLNKIQARVLFLPSANDLLLQPYLTRRAYEIMNEQNKDVAYETLAGPWGHLDGVFGIEEKASVIQGFLNN